MAVHFTDTPDNATTNGAVSVNLGDGASNGVRVTSLAIETLAPPGYAADGEFAVATTPDPDGAYGDAGAQFVSLYIRMDQTIDAG